MLFYCSKSNFMDGCNVFRWLYLMTQIFYSSYYKYIVNTVFEIRGNNHCGGVIFQHSFRLVMLKNPPSTVIISSYFEHCNILHTVSDRLNTLGVYLKIQNFKGVFIQEGHLIKRGVYFKMHKFRKQKYTFSGTCSNTRFF